MTSSQIETILHPGNFKGPHKKWKLVETHISFVLLGQRYAYKFKKEIRYSFLDFSTLARRKHFCERELVLNNRLSSGVYLKVVPVRKLGDKLIIGGKKGVVVDYALKMKKLQEAKQMHLMLEKKLVTQKHIEAVATLIRNFHRRTTVIKTKFNQQEFADRFNDIASVSNFIKNAGSPEQVKIIENAIRISNRFLNRHKELFADRIDKGFVRDCHGDLHSRNIFLYHKPVVFDCIEFNDAFRQIDILDELAFFCMDLEAEGFHKLSSAFTTYYFGKGRKDFGEKEQLLFTYYKCYRANVRAKVNALRAMQASGPVLKKNLEAVKKYLDLVNSYLGRLD